MTKLKKKTPNGVCRKKPRTITPEKTLKQTFRLKHTRQGGGEGGREREGERASEGGRERESEGGWRKTGRKSCRSCCELQVFLRCCSRALFSTKLYRIHENIFFGWQYCQATQVKSRKFVPFTILVCVLATFFVRTRKRKVKKHSHQRPSTGANERQFIRCREQNDD